MFAVVPAACVGISFLLTIFLPLTKKRAMEIRAILDERKRELFVQKPDGDKESIEK
jgi:Na+/melibiose symporter-like transporter